MRGREGRSKIKQKEAEKKQEKLAGWRKQRSERMDERQAEAAGMSRDSGKKAAQMTAEPFRPPGPRQE